jgi:outer membrane protein TolC
MSAADAFSGPTARDRRASSPRLRLALCLLLLLDFGANKARPETLTLADCLRETIEHNPLIIQKRLALEEAGGARLIFRSRVLPTLTVGGLAGQQGEQTTGMLRVTTKVGTKSVTMIEESKRPSTLFLIGNEALYQPLFDAAIPASLRRGNVELAVARSNFLATAVGQLYAARVQFYGAFFQQENGAVLRGIKKTIAANAKGIGQLVQAGLAGRQQELAAEIQQGNFEPQVIANTGALQGNLTTLLETMGRPLGAGAALESSITLAGPWDDANLDFQTAAVAKEACARRPDLQVLRDLVRSNTEDANIQRGGYYPLIRAYVTGELLPESFVQGQHANTVRPEDNTQQTQISPGARYDWSVVDTGIVRGGVHRLESQRDALAIALHQMEADIPGQLEQVRAQAASGARERDLFQSNVATATDTFSMIAAGVAQGINNQLEFLDAQNGILAARAGLLSAELRISSAHAEFDRVTGGYLRFVSE